MTQMSDWSEASSVGFEVPEGLLNLRFTLDCGQAFRWRESADGWWTGVLGDRATRVRREGPAVVGQLFPPAEDAEARLAAYFRLDVDLAALYEAFGAVDRWIASATALFSGLRVLSQEPEETLLSYVCSTANSVPRIAKAVRQMSTIYGEHIATLDGEEYHAFPTSVALADASPQVLREQCGLGWRGDNLKRVAGDLAAMPSDWIEGLKSADYGNAKRELTRIHGIGAKIADCVCLFALGKDEAVPVDTHIWALAKEIFSAEIPTRTLTPATYEIIAGLFVGRYGEFAGWAQEYLYLQRRAAQGRVRTEA